MTKVNEALINANAYAGEDNADNAISTTAVVANEDGSILERLEQVQEATNKGSGTALGTNKSLPDALGTNGTTVVDSAVSVLGAVGANNADNAFVSNLVAANVDGSVLERLEHIKDAIATADGKVVTADGVIDAIKAIVGTLTDIAADTTDTATVIALLRQIVEAVNNGAGSAIGSDLSLVDIIGAFDGGVDPQGDIYQALGVDTTNSIKALIDAVQAVTGILTDTAADTTDTATIIALLRQIVEAVNNGTGSAIGSNLSLVDLLGAFDGGADPQGDVYQALGVDATNSVKALIDAVQAVTGELTDTADETASTATAMNMLRALLDNRQVPRVARKEFTFSELTTGAVGAHDLFTVTGAVKVKMYAVCTTGLTPAVAGATISLGIVGTVAAFIVATTAADLLAGELWFDATPTTLFDTDANAGLAKAVIGDGADIILGILVQAVASGVITFVCEWEPITADGNVVAAA